MSYQYYIAGIPFSDELYHHGIRGQKWGVRRYQNPDGSLTPEGRERYGKELGPYAGKHGVIRKLVTGDWPLGFKRFGEIHERNSYRRAEKAEREGKTERAEAYRREGDVTKKKNIARDKYLSNTSTGKAFLQNYLLGRYGANAYRAARGQGKTIGESITTGLLENLGALVLPVGSIIPAAIYESYATKTPF